MAGRNVAGGVKKEAVDAAGAPGAPWLTLRTGGVVMKEPVEEPTDAGKELIREEVAEASAGKRRREEESGDEAAMGVGKKRRRVAVAAAPSSRATGADGTAAAIVPTCRCSILCSMPPLQRLLDACRDVFKGTPPPPLSIVVPFICRLMGLCRAAPCVVVEREHDHGPTIFASSDPEIY
jgi:hypothetical protein